MRSRTGNLRRIDTRFHRVDDAGRPECLVCYIEGDADALLELIEELNERVRKGGGVEVQR